MTIPEARDRDAELIKLLTEALKREPPEQEAFLRRVCKDDALVADALHLIQSEDDHLRFLTSPYFSMSELALNTLFEDGAGADADPAIREIGPYRLERVIGEGGMGRVFLAAQSTPVNRKVAIKLMRASVVGAGAAPQFVAERQALARLNHPNIGQMYEAGATAEGHPYFVMEYIDGLPITDFCDLQQMSVDDRLMLFIAVCQGVHHSHQKRLLHLDLKPSNILVTLVDGVGVPKIIDFGIAKRLDDPLPKTSEAARLKIIGTPDYASPELLAEAADPADLDTRADVYSLGILLHELLCGVRPCDCTGLSLDEVRQRLSKRQPINASQLFGELDARTAADIVSARNTTVRRLKRELAGDLDAIVAKATAVEPDARYASTNELAEDIKLYFEHEATYAHPPTWRYRHAKLIRRHASAFSITLLIVASLAAGLTYSAYQQRQTARALAESEVLSQFLVDLFKSADPDSVNANRVTARELLESGADRIRETEGIGPDNRARLLHSLSEIHTELFLLDDAEALTVEALSIREKLGEDHSLSLVESLNQLGIIYRMQGRFDEAEPPLLRALEIAERGPKRDAHATALSLNHLGNLRWKLKKFDEAERDHLRALRIRQSMPARTKIVDIAESHNNLGVMLLEQRRYSAAEEHVEKARALFSQSYGENHPRFAITTLNLAIIKENLAHWSQAERYHRQTVALFEELFYPDHRRAIRARRNLARYLRVVGELAESVSLSRQNLSYVDAEPVPDARAIAAELRTLGVSLVLQGDMAAAERAFSRALRLHEKREAKQDIVAARANLAWLLRLSGDHQRAEAELRSLIDLQEALPGARKSVSAFIAHNLGLAVAAQQRADEAEGFLRTALEMRSRVFGRHRLTAETMYELGLLLQESGATAEASTLLHDALDIRAQTLPPGNVDIERSIDAVARLEAAR